MCRTQPSSGPPPRSGAHPGRQLADALCLSQARSHTETPKPLKGNRKPTASPCHTEEGGGGQVRSEGRCPQGHGISLPGSASSRRPWARGTGHGWRVEQGQAALDEINYTFHTPENHPTAKREGFSLRSCHFPARPTQGALLGSVPSGLRVAGRGMPGQARRESPRRVRERVSGAQRPGVPRTCSGGGAVPLRSSACPPPSG